MIRHSGTAWVALSFVLSLALPARGDAVPPPPDHCPSGMVPVTDHGGPRCEKEAPTSCPNGWRGVIGGECTLAVCSDDSQCQSEGKVCRPQQLCFEPRQRDYSCDSNDRARPGPELAAPGPRVLGGPCAKLPEPVTDWVPVNLCSAGHACDSPSECRPSGLCVTASAPPPAPQKVGPSGTLTPKPSGCGSGCVGAGTGPSSSAGFLAAFAVVLVAAGCRRRR